jgi:hypothetical protein
MPTLTVSSTALTTGAPRPSVTALTPARTPAFIRCTHSEITTPTTTGTHCFDS